MPPEIRTRVRKKGMKHHYAKPIISAILILVVVYLVQCLLVQLGGVLVDEGRSINQSEG